MTSWRIAGRFTSGTCWIVDCISAIARSISSSVRSRCGPARVASASSCGRSRSRIRRGPASSVDRCVVRLVGERLGAPAHDDRGQVVAVGPTALLGLVASSAAPSCRIGADVSQVAISLCRHPLQTPSVHSTRMSPLRSGVRRDRSMTGSTRPPRQLNILLRSGMLGHVGGADHALVDEVLHLRMILGVADQAALPEQVEARIAGVRPVRVARLHDAGDAGRARRLEHRELVRVRAERRVRAQHRLLQELERIAAAPASLPAGSAR